MTEEDRWKKTDVSDDNRWARITPEGKYHHHYFSTGWYTDCGFRFRVRPIEYLDRSKINPDDICKKCDQSAFVR